jgi:hypothetical protein
MSNTQALCLEIEICDPAKGLYETQKVRFLFKRQKGAITVPEVTLKKRVYARYGTSVMYRRTGPAFITFVSAKNKAELSN